MAGSLQCARFENSISLHSGSMGRFIVDLHQPRLTNDWNSHFLRDVSNSEVIRGINLIIDGTIRLVLFMVPPNGIVFIFILGTLTLIIGMGLGWGWGVIAMKAALAARPAADTQAKLQALGQHAYSVANSTGQPVATVQQQLIYEGWMLDTRVSAVYFCFICFLVYVLVSLACDRWKNYAENITNFSIGAHQSQEPQIHSYADLWNYHYGSFHHHWATTPIIQWNHAQGSHRASSNWNWNRTGLQYFVFPNIDFPHRPRGHGRSCTAPQRPLGCDRGKFDR
jgi:hypothetical protein